MTGRRSILAAGAALPLAGALSGALTGVPARPALAQGPWPSRPIRMIVPYPPGGATDAMARLAAQKLSEGLGVTVVVDNRVGGNGILGGQALLQAPPDGHTIMSAASIHVMGRQVLRACPFDPVADFLPVSRFARGALVLVLDPALPQRDVASVVAAAKAAPNRWSFATSSLGSAGHLASIEFNRRTGAAVEVVPYRGSSPALNDIMAGNVQMMFDPALATLPLVRGDKVRALGITTLERSAVAPEIPTLAEVGLPGFEFFSWYAVWAPRGTDPAIVERMNRVLAEGVHQPEVVARLTGLGFEPVREDPAAFARYIDADVARNAELLRIANFQPE